MGLFDNRANNQEKTERQLGPAEQFRSQLVFKISEIDTPASLEREHGLEVVDADTLAQRGIAQASGVLQNVLGIQPQPELPTPQVTDPTNRALEELGYGQEPLPGFNGQAPMPPIERQDRYDLAA